VTGSLYAATQDAEEPEAQVEQTSATDQPEDSRSAKQRAKAEKKAEKKKEEAKKLKKKELPEGYQWWLDLVDLLITKEEKDAFLRIHKDYQRDAFIERFWKQRDGYMDTARNEFREEWMERAEEAMAITEGDLMDDRARTLLLNDTPDAIIEYKCFELWPGQVWYYRRAPSLGQEIVLLYYQPGGLGRHRLWYPTEGMRVLLQFAGDNNSSDQFFRTIQNNCGQTEGEAVLSAIAMARAWGELGYVTAIADLMRPEEQHSGEWVETFQALSTDIDDDALTFNAELLYDFPARHKTRTVIQGQVAIPQDQVAMADLAGARSYNFVLTGEVLRDNKLFDTFRYSFNIPDDLGEQDRIPLIFERYLRPGAYTFVVKLEDLNGDKFFISKDELEVPHVDNMRRPPPADPETARILEEANAAISSGDTTIRIVPPRGELQTGMLRLDTMTTGPIDYVTFTVDDDQNLTKRNPPYSVEVDLGHLPRTRKLAAVAFDEADTEVARDEIELNSGTHRFAVRLIEPRRGRRYVNSLRAEAKVDVPRDKAVQKVEFYLNEELKATLFQPPFVQPILLPAEEQLAYVRAVAYQPDGNFTEDLVYVNAPDYLEEVDVQFVELFIAVLNKEARPVEGLSETDFQVFEDGVAQTPMRFDLVDNLPIHAGILVDVSASMDPSMDMAQKGALQFFEQAITPKDRATLITFNDHPHLATKFTNDVQTLASGLAGLKAERGTALYDSTASRASGPWWCFPTARTSTAASPSRTHSSTRAEPEWPSTPSASTSAVRRATPARSCVASPTKPAAAPSSSRPPRSCRGSTTRSSASCAHATTSPTSRPTAARKTTSARSKSSSLATASTPRRCAATTPSLPPRRSGLGARQP
jgi:GWxTD domain-containing protein